MQIYLYILVFLLSNFYEPIYNRVRTRMDERGFVTTYIFDYQEGTDYAELAERSGSTPLAVQTALSNAGIPMGMGDINGDGVTDGVIGRVIKTGYPADISGLVEKLVK